MPKPTIVQVAMDAANHVVRVPCSELREESLWVHLVAELLQLSRVYCRRGEGIRALRCEEILKSIESFLRVHGEGRECHLGSIQGAARRRLSLDRLTLAPAMEFEAWKDCLAVSGMLASLGNLDAKQFGAARHVASIYGAIQAMAASVSVARAVSS